MKFRSTMLPVLLVTAVLFTTGIAFAQTPSPVPAPSVLTPQIAIVTIISLIVGFLGQAINTGSIFGFQTVPKAWIPYLTLGGSFLAAFGVSLQGDATLNGTAWFNAVMAGFGALVFAAGGSAAHTHFNAHKNFVSKNGGGDGGNGATATTTPPPAAPADPPPAAPAAKKIGVLAPAVVVLTLSLSVGGTVATQTGCGWFGANNNQVVSDVGQIASCVIAQLFQGVTDPLKIVGACQGATMADVEQIIASIINYYDQPDASAAVAASDKHCGVGNPPYKGMDQCATTAQLTSFKTAHTNVKAQIAAGAH